MCAVLCYLLFFFPLVFRQQLGLGRRWRAGLCVRVGLSQGSGRSRRERTCRLRRLSLRQPSTMQTDPTHLAAAGAPPPRRSPGGTRPSFLPPPPPASEKDARRERRTSKQILRLPPRFFCSTVACFFRMILQVCCIHLCLCAAGVCPEVGHLD